MEVVFRFNLPGAQPGPRMSAILTLNSGSSSLKFGLYTEDGQTLLASGSATKIGAAASSLAISDPAGKRLFSSDKPIAHQQDALNTIADQLAAASLAPVGAVGHRVVHGGPHLVTHQLLTSQVLQTLEQSTHFAPLHIPPALALIHAAEARFPGVSQFACFDTAFHQTMPAEAYTYPLPAGYREAGVRRYGFHGLSYESVVYALQPYVPERLIVAHLGSGASVCAILQGQSVDTSMGLSPTGGIVMGTRTGDLDPGVILLLSRGLPPALSPAGPDKLETLLNHSSGLEALTGSSDMEKIQRDAGNGDAQAALAVEIFCREAAKTIAGYVTVLGGCDLLVFTGGIGEHSEAIRQSIAQRLRPLFPQAAGPAVRTIPADEDGQIARHVATLQATR